MKITNPDVKAQFESWAETRGLDLTWVPAGGGVQMYDNGVEVDGSYDSPATSLAFSVWVHLEEREENLLKRLDVVSASMIKHYQDPKGTENAEFTTYSAGVVAGIDMLRHSLGLPDEFDRGGIENDPRTEEEI